MPQGARSCAELIGGWVINQGSQLKWLLATENMLWLTQLARTKTQSLMPFLIICLGLLALKSGVPEDVWTVLSFL